MKPIEKGDTPPVHRITDVENGQRHFWLSYTHETYKATYFEPYPQRLPIKTDYPKKVIS